MDGYQGILFPSRAEDLRQQLFKSYRVFLEYWDGLSEKLRFRYEELALSRRSTALLVYAPQGGGKTLLADKLKQGLERAKTDQDPAGDPSNLWHRLTGGSSLDPKLIREATRVTHLLHIEDDRAWTHTASEWYKHRQPHEHSLIVADNAERGYFIQGLLGLDDKGFMELGRTDGAYQLAAERFVALARTTIRPALFLFLTNNEEFALNFSSRVNGQHRDLVSLEVLPLPSDRDKETAVRVNTNLLNQVTYWYCLDRAGPEGKKRVRSAITGNETFPGSFSAVNEALAHAERTGRPANKCILSLIVFTDADALPPTIKDAIGHTWDKFSWACEHLRVEYFDSGWAVSLIPDDVRRAKMLESEWNLRLITVSNRLLAALFDQKAQATFSAILEKLETIHGVGSRDATIGAHWTALQEQLEQVPATWDHAHVDAFWGKGQVRSHDYESALCAIRPTYNRTATGFLSYRPDLTVQPYRVCSIVDAVSDSPDAINEAIKRRAHVFEFTAVRQYTADLVQRYLASKLSNYVQVLEQQ